MQEIRRDDTRSRIIEAALKLLRRHGEDKLTVVDIARSLGMSHANVYRFFRNKTDILDAIVDEWLKKVEAFLEQVVTGPGTAAERIEATVLHLHLKRRQKFLDDSEVYESFRRLFELRPDAAPRHRQAIMNVFKRLIAEGVANGEFLPIDPDEAAAVLKDATALFLHPLMIPTVLHQPTEERARTLVRYFLAAITPGSNSSVLRANSETNKFANGKTSSRRSRNGGRFSSTTFSR